MPGWGSGLLVVGLLGVCLGGLGCERPDRGEADRPAGGVGSAPGFIYPEEAPEAPIRQLSVWRQESPSRCFAVVVLRASVDAPEATHKVLVLASDLLDLHRQNGFAVVGVSLDAPVRWTSHVRPMLRHAEANFPVMLLDGRAGLPVDGRAGPRLSSADAGDPLARAMLAAADRPGDAEPSTMPADAASTALRREEVLRQWASTWDGTTPVVLLYDAAREPAGQWDHQTGIREADRELRSILDRPQIRATGRP